MQDNIHDIIKVLNLDTSFPAAEFLVAVGLFLVLIVEQVSLECKPDAQSRQVFPAYSFKN